MAVFGVLGSYPNGRFTNRRCQVHVIEFPQEILPELCIFGVQSAVKTILGLKVSWQSKFKVGLTDYRYVFIVAGGQA